MRERERERVESVARDRERSERGVRRGAAVQTQPRQRGLKNLASFLFILKHSHPDRPPGRGMTLLEATIYGTFIQLINGFARVFARLASKTMPRLAEPPAKKAADERGLMLKTAILFGGRTFVRGSGFLVGGVLLQYVR